MRRDDQCENQGHNPVPAGCLGSLAVKWTCQVEGREVRMCSFCDRAWKAQAREIPALRLRCPNCAGAYLAARTPGPRIHRTGSAHAPQYTGPLADAFTRAMVAEGVLEDVRARVLARLAADEDPYIASLLRSVAMSAAVSA